MNLTFLRLPRSRNRLSRRATARPAPPSEIAVKTTPTIIAPPPQETLDELRIKLRKSFEEAGQGYFDLGEVVNDDTVLHCQVFANRHRAIETLPKGGIVAEVGTQTGHFADHIFKAAQPKSLHLFDLSLEWFDKSVLVEPIQDGRVQIHLGDSSTELAKFPAEHFDWLYIDGNHSYDGVIKDIAEAIRTVKRDGILVFNDYTTWSPLEVCNYGVLKAVNELVNGGEWEFLYLALHPWGYHDVALRRRNAATLRSGRELVS
jgi:hypothetical protein